MNDEQTVVSWDVSDDYPSDDSERTWHVHPNGSWAYGIVCDECHTELEERDPLEPKVHFNIHHLKRQNSAGTTTASEVADVLSNVKPENRDKIGRAR